MKNKLLKGGGLLTIGAIIGSLSGFLRNLFVARLVSVEDYGIASLFALTMSFIEMMSNLGVDRIIIQYQKGYTKLFVGSAHAFQLFRSFFISLVLYFSAGLITDFFDIQYATWAFEILAIVPFIRGLLNHDIFRQQRVLSYRAHVISEALPQLISLAALYPISLLVNDYSILLWLIILQITLTVILSHLLARRPYQLAIDFMNFKKIYLFGWPLMLNGLLMFIIFQGDKLVVGRVFDMEILGWYSAAFMFTFMPSVVIAKVYQSLFLPILSAAQTKDDLFRNRLMILLQTTLLTLVMYVFIFDSLGEWFFILFFGEKYAEASIFLVFLAATQAVRLAKSGPIIVALAKGDSKITFYSNVPRGIALLIVIYMAFEKIQINEIILAAFIGELVSYFFSLYLLHARLSLNLNQFLKTLIKVILLTTFIFMMMRFLQESIELDVFSYFILSVLSIFLIYKFTMNSFIEKLYIQIR